MEFIGNLKAKVGERSGDGANGPWRISSYLLETVEMYPKKMVVEVRDNTELWEMYVGKNVAIRFNIDAHEYQGRWFNSIRAYSIREVKQEESASRNARKNPQPTGEIVNASPENQEIHDVDWDGMAKPEDKGASPSPSNDGDAKADDLPF